MAKQRRVNRSPLRRVLQATLREGRVGLFTANGIYTRWYEMKLECGHEVERTARYRPPEQGRARRGWARLHHLPDPDLALPPAKRVRCESCPAPAPELSHAMK